MSPSKKTPRDQSANLCGDDAKYRILVENAQEGILVMQGRERVYYNPRWLEITDYSTEEYKNIPFLSLSHPEDAAIVAETYKKLINGKAFDPYMEFRIVARSGVIKYLGVKLSRIEWDGQLAGMVLANDITERKEAENEIVKAKERAEESEKKLLESLINLELAQKIASIGNWLFDPEVGIPVWSDEIYKIYERDKQLGPPHVDEYKRMYDEAQYNIFIEAFRSAMENGLPYDIVLKFRPPNDNEKWIRAICQPDTSKKSAKGYFLRGTIQDITERMRTEQALKKSESSFRLLAENSKDMIYRMSIPDGIYEYVSPASVDLFGYSPSEFYTHPKLIEKVIHPDWKAYFEEEWTKLLAGDLSPTYEYQIIHKQGDIRWMNQRNSLIKDGCGKPIAIEGAVTDITERKAVEEALRNNQKRYKKAQEMGRVGNWEYDPNTTNFWGSDEAKRIYGFDLDSKEFATDTVESCILERERVHQALVDLLEKDQKYDLEFDILTYDKGIRKTIHSIAEVERDAQGNPLKITGVISDITERKQAKEALLQSEKLLKNAAATAKLGHFQIHVQTGKGSWSEEIFRIFDRDPAEGEPTVDEYRTLVHEDDVENLYQLYAESIQELKPFDLIYRIRRPNGEIRYVHSLWSVDRNPEGDGEMILGTLQDITESQLAEMELEKHRKHLEELVKQRTDELEAKMKEHKTLFDMMIGREVRMADLKKVIKSLRKQLKDNKIIPVANDPMLTNDEEY